MAISEQGEIHPTSGWSEMTETKTRQAWLAGYGQALADIAVRLVEDGEDGVARWIEDNTLDADRKQSFLAAWRTGEPTVPDEG